MSHATHHASRRCVLGQTVKCVYGTPGAVPGASGDPTREARKAGS